MFQRPLLPGRHAAKTERDQGVRHHAIDFDGLMTVLTDAKIPVVELCERLIDIL